MSSDRDRIAGAVLALLLLGSGLALWFLFLGTGAERAWRAVLINFLFFTSLAGGLVTWSAIVLASNGSWPGPLERYTFVGLGFAIPSLLTLALLWLASDAWAPWPGHTFHQGFWLDNDFLFARDLAALAAFWGFAFVYVRRRRQGEGRSLAGWLVLVYCLTWSLLGFDLVMALDPHWYSSLAGGYFFISGLYIAVLLWALLACLRPETDDARRHDLGKLVVAFSILTTYMMYAQLMPIWYENLPHETIFVRPRLYGDWRWVSRFLLALVYLGPLVLLLPVRAKRSRVWLGGLTVLLLGGMWCERWWLVAPVFAPAPQFGLPEAGSIAAFAGLAALALGRAWRRGEGNHG
jgi:hypothetical protein